MTLVSVHNSDGTGGRCDAKCYAAKTGQASCDCVCGGANHGVGVTKALENTREFAEEWLERYKDEHGLQEAASYVTPDARQLAMF